MGPQGMGYFWYPLQGFVAPAWMRLGGWLAGARQLHFAAAWFLVINGLVYLGYAAAAGEWRRRFFLPTRDSVNAAGTFAFYLHIRSEPPATDFFNGLQRISFTTAVVLGVVIVLSGLDVYKPVQLYWLLWIFGSYDVARLVHLLAAAGLALFTLIHVVLVALHPKTLIEMVVGGRRA